MSRQPKKDHEVDAVRRKLLKAGTMAGGALAAGLLPYEKPAVKSFFGTRGAWAQVTGPLTITFDGQLGVSAPGTPESTGQDLWEFEVRVAATTLTITVVPDANLDIELFLFAPGDGPGDTNLLTGTVFGFTAAGVGGSEAATVGPLAAAGFYTLGIEDDRSPLNQVAGEYTGTIDADNPLGPATLVGDEVPQSDLRS